MNKIVIALAALFASAMFAPAAQALDCDADDASDIADCMRSIMKAPAIRQVLPPTARPPAAIKGDCDADDADDLKECLRGLKMPGVGQLMPKGARPTAESPSEAMLPEKAELAPAAASPAKLRGLDDGTLCQKYFPNVGKLVSVPCPE